MIRFWKWLSKEQKVVEAEPKPSKEERIKILRQQIHDMRVASDKYYDEQSTKYQSENPDKYRLVVVTETQGYGSKEFVATASYYKRTPTPWMHRDEEESLIHELARGPYEYVMPTFRTAKQNAESEAQRIMQANSHYYHEKTNTYIPAKEIKLVRVEQV
jgi:hypothetical protein